MALAV